MTERTCPDCAQPYGPDSFTGYFHQRCPGCESAHRRARNQRNKQLLEQRRPGHARAYSRAYYRSHRGTYISKAALYRRANAHVDLTNRARQRGAEIVERFAPGEIFERDRWICQICRQPINPELSFPDPESGSIDHIRPISDGGQHSRANCAATHLSCNQHRYRWLRRRVAG